jgi:V/A-type H+-transporting ATPase subunit E
MEIQLQELIDKIKKDGIESASEEAVRVKREAEAEAQHIVAAAKKEAEAIVERGKEDAERSAKAGAAALEQASRNQVHALKAEIQTLLDKIVTTETAAALGDGVLTSCLPDLLKNWASKGGAVDLLLPEEQLKRLQSWFSSKLAAELKGGVELKADRNLGAGFKISNKDGSAYYDFSAESVAELLSAYLNPRLTEILKTAAKGI